MVVLIPKTDGRLRLPTAPSTARFWHPFAPFSQHGGETESKAFSRRRSSSNERGSVVAGGRGRGSQGRVQSTKRRSDRGSRDASRGAARRPSVCSELGGSSRRCDATLFFADPPFVPLSRCRVPAPVLRKIRVLLFSRRVGQSPELACSLPAPAPAPATSHGRGSAQCPLISRFANENLLYAPR